MRFAPALLVVLAACSEKGPQQPAAVERKPAASVTPEARPALSAEEQRAIYIDACRKAPALDEYCSCGWEVFSRNVTQQEMRAPVSRERLAEVTALTSSACADKLPESVVRTSFVDSCTGDEAGAAAYCECFWSELRKSYAPADSSVQRSQGSRSSWTYHARSRSRSAARSSPRTP